MKVVADCGNRNYFMTRAIELLRTEPNNANHEIKQLRQSIGLLALAIAEIENGQAKVTNKK